MKTLISRFLNILPDVAGTAAATMVAAAILCSCSQEIVIDGVPQPYANEITFAVSAAARTQYAATRAIAEGGTADNTVNEITVLLFDAATEEYRSFVRTTALQPVPTGTGNENRWKFTARLPEGSYLALFMANAAEMIGDVYDLTEGTVIQGGGDMAALTISDVEWSLSRTFAGKYNAVPGSDGYTPFVMSSGRVDVTVPFASANQYLDNPVRLARDVAKINVRFASKAASDRFEIHEIRLCNYNTVSYAVPSRALWQIWNDRLALLDPSTILFVQNLPRPAAAVINGYDENTSIVYRRIDGEITNDGCVDWIFIPERPFERDDNMFLLVKGNVTIDGEKRDNRWYKLEFVRKNKGNVEPVNILRNYVYTMNITDVSDPGYPSPEEAAEALPGNMTVDLEVADDGLNNVVYNGQYYLAVTKNEYVFSCISELEQKLDIRTDYPGGWKISPAPSAWPEWLTKELPWTSGEAGPKDLTAADHLWASVNVTDTTREFALTVTAGSLSQRIVVRQNPNSYIFATPGVVGIRLSDYRRLMNARARSGNPALLDPSVQLSLKGSSTYGGSIVDNAGAKADFGGALESEPVYSVYTMFGSTVAILMATDEKWAEDGSRVVWTNLEYNGSTTGPWTGGPITAADIKPNGGTDYDIVDNPAKAHGDICRAISGNEYRIPAGNPWQLADGTAPFGNTGYIGNNGKEWWELPGAPDYWKKGAPNAPNVGISDIAILADKAHTIFLPAAGYVNDGDMKSMGRTIRYRTSTASIRVENGQSLNYHDRLFASATSFDPSASEASGEGFPVRCVKAATPVVVTPPDPPLLAYERTNMPAVLPQPGGKWTITAKTNLSTWGIRVYQLQADGTATLFKDISNIAGSQDESYTEFTETFAIDANAGNDPRLFKFYVYSKDFPTEIYCCQRAQEAALTLPQTGFPAPPGVLGVTRSGELTLRGSKLYSGTVVEDNSQFGKVHEEDVFVAYFRWGSLVAINSTSNPGSPNGANALVSNGDAFGFSDFDWIHPDYTYGGQKGGKALKALLGNSTAGTAWSTLPMNGTLDGWKPANTVKAHGDPCPYATINAAKAKATGWHVPGGSGGWNGIAEGSLESRLVNASVKLTNGWVVKGRRDPNTGTNGWGMFLPFAGFRQNSGVVAGRGQDGNYWSATRYSTMGGNYLSTNEYGAGLAQNPNDMGFPIRCVK